MRGRTAAFVSKNSGLRGMSAVVGLSSEKSDGGTSDAPMLHRIGCGGGQVRLKEVHRGRRGLRRVKLLAKRVCDLTQGDGTNAITLRKRLCERGCAKAPQK